MGLLAAMVSNRPEKASLALEAYRQNEDETPEWLIVTPARHEKAMKKAGLELDATVVVEEKFRDALPQSLQDPFVSSFGGFRNMALAHAAKSRKSVVFLDDDTQPQNDVFRRHARWLQEAGLVIGKYSGHVGGASTSLLDLTHALEKMEDGRMNQKEFEAVLNLRLCGVPPVQKPVEHAGCVGGNLGIHWKTAQRQAFVPLPYRVEDGTYATLCQDAVANPPVAQSAVVRHEKQGRPDGLVKELAGDWTGNVLAACIVANQKKQKMSLAEVTAQIRKGMLLDYFAEKYEKARFRHEALDRIEKMQVALSAAEAANACRAYLAVQDVWTQSWEAVG